MTDLKLYFLLLFALLLLCSFVFFFFRYFYKRELRIKNLSTACIEWVGKCISRTDLSKSISFMLGAYRGYAGNVL
ncbi:hypothetical protein [Streptococcus mitis]|uniref:Uncharacterized protein n=1 Tax=Streptococcus mitis TaxID=28037 RepID=A0A1X1JX09_STRMT|nr:hypothetical protein [Streptococcus mitis]ORO91680.1 hypothetical protein B7700_09580 [Streptococcus mitis]RSI87820.1 hypothetical protein D8853_01100 [Streptococcus mitis]RSI92109.1 hypothetical protein D8848_01310 [Streptococcus mitis]RSJ14937.1 hypothetical protein D8836_02440 [Streptococcus mitis]